MLEHDPVITISRRPGARAHLIADEARLAREGVTIAETDRGGDITYHGPGQLVVYPILDLNALRLRLHDYMRALEESVIRLCDRLGLHAQREPGATGVWIRTAPGEEPAKVCAMGVRVTRWVSMHGLALNVNPRMDHFDLIVPCGLIGRRVTSLRALMGDRCPDMPSVKAMLAEALAGVLGTRLVWERRDV
jgi:lipoyl(octanoyl) transferase